MDPPLQTGPPCAPPISFAEFVIQDHLSLLFLSSLIRLELGEAQLTAEMELFEKLKKAQQERARLPGLLVSATQDGIKPSQNDDESLGPGARARF